MENLDWLLHKAAGGLSIEVIEAQINGFVSDQMRFTGKSNRLNTTTTTTTTAWNRKTLGRDAEVLVELGATQAEITGEEQQQ